MSVAGDLMDERGRGS